MTVIRIGAVQFKPILGAIDINQKKMIKFLDMAYRYEIELIVFPELSNSGYNFSSRDEAFSASEEIPDGKTTRILEKYAREYDMYIVSGINERSGNELFNSAVLIGPNGYIGTYRKVHLFYREKDIFRRGDTFNVFDVGKAKIGIMICFDWIFPEAARTLALKGADIIAHPVNLVLPYWQKVCPLRALENRVYIISANRIGIEGDLTFTGQTIIVNPKGEVIAMASKTQEEIIYADIDLSVARDKNITPKNNIFEDRAPDAYYLDK